MALLAIALLAPALQAPGVGTVSPAEPGDEPDRMDPAVAYAREEAVQPIAKSVIDNRRSSSSDAPPAGRLASATPLPLAGMPPVTVQEDVSFDADEVLFDNARTSSSGPRFQVNATDPEGDDVRYEIAAGSAPGLADKLLYSSPSSSASGSPVQVAYAGSALADGVTYYWRARAQDPLGSASFGPWTGNWSFTKKAAGGTDWFQTAQPQFDSDAHYATGTANESGGEARLSSVYTSTLEGGQYGGWDSSQECGTYPWGVTIAQDDWHRTGPHVWKAVEGGNKSNSVLTSPPVPVPANAASPHLNFRLSMETEISGGLAYDFGWMEWRSGGGPWVDAVDANFTQTPYNANLAATSWCGASVPPASGASRVWGGAIGTAGMVEVNFTIPLSARGADFQFRFVFRANDFNPNCGGACPGGMNLDDLGIYDGPAAIWFDDVEYLGEGWSVSSECGTNPWTIAAQLPGWYQNGSQTWQVAEPGAVSTSTLQSPTFPIPAGSSAPQARFWLRTAGDLFGVDAVDHAWLEYRTGAGLWEKALASQFAQNGYNQIVSPSVTSFCGWSTPPATGATTVWGATFGLSEVMFDIPPAAVGSTFQFRLVYRTNNRNNGGGQTCAGDCPAGVKVDEISIVASGDVLFTDDVERGARAWDAAMQCTLRGENRFALTKLTSSPVDWTSWYRSADHVWKASEYSFGSMAELTSPVFPVPAGATSPRVKFWMRGEMEVNPSVPANVFDYAWMERRVAGGAWAPFTDSEFVQNGYNKNTIDPLPGSYCTGSSNPPASGTNLFWGGTIGAFGGPVEVVAAVPASAVGSTFQFRLVFKTDTGNCGSGCPAIPNGFTLDDPALVIGEGSALGNGTLRSTQVRFASGPPQRSGWGQVRWNATIPLGGPPPAIVRVSAERFVAGAWVATGLASTTSPLDLSTLGPEARVRLVADLNYSGGSPVRPEGAAPVLLDWSVGWLVGSPGVPTLLSPAPGGRTTGNSVTLAWAAGAGGYSENYTVLAGESDPPTSPAPGCSSTPATSCVFSTNDSTTYYWLVAAYNPLGSNQSPVASFRENGLPTVGPDPTYPPRGSYLPVGISTSINWSASGADPDNDTALYHVQVANATPVVCPGPNCELDSTTANLSWPGNTTVERAYYWRVRHYDGYEYGNWSQEWNFTIGVARNWTLRNGLNQISIPVDRPVAMRTLWSIISAGAPGVYAYEVSWWEHNLSGYRTATCAAGTGCVAPASWAGENLTLEPHRSYFVKVAGAPEGGVNVSIVGPSFTFGRAIWLPGGGKAVMISISSSATTYNASSLGASLVAKAGARTLMRLMKWDAAAQAYLVADYDYYAGRWIGDEFDIARGDGIWAKVSGGEVGGWMP